MYASIIPNTCSHLPFHDHCMARGEGCQIATPDDMTCGDNLPSAHVRSLPLLCYTALRTLSQLT